MNEFKCWIVRLCFSFLGIVALASTLWSNEVLAQPSATDRATAEALFDQALTEMDAGNPQAACPKLEESQRLDPGVGTLLYLAACYEKVGRSASAWATFMEAGYAAEAAGQPDRKQVADDNAARLKPTLSKLIIDVAQRDTAGLEINNDGNDVNQALWGSEIPVDPGKHRITASAPGRTSWEQEVDVPAGPGVVSVLVPALAEDPNAMVGPAPPPQPQPSATEPPAAAPPAATPSDEDPGASQRTWGWIGVAGGSALLVGGGIFSFLAVADNGRADDACRRDDPTLCSERGVDLSDSAQTKATMATVLGGLGGAVAITGVVLVFTAPDSNTATLELAPVWLAQGAGVTMEGRF